MSQLTEFQLDQYRRYAANLRDRLGYEGRLLVPASDFVPIIEKLLSERNRLAVELAEIKRLAALTARKGTAG